MTQETTFLFSLFSVRAFHKIPAKKLTIRLSLAKNFIKFIFHSKSKKMMVWINKL